MMVKIRRGYSRSINLNQEAHQGIKNTWRPSASSLILLNKMYDAATSVVCSSQANVARVPRR